MSVYNQVCFVGLGYIGLPTAAVVARGGQRVLGVDVNEKVVQTINTGNIHIIEPGLGDVVKCAVASGTLRAASKPEISDVYLVVVPTPFTHNYEPDISYVEAATKSVIPLLKAGDLYILESTSPVGTTEKMASIIFETRPELKGSIAIAYCPERVLPGNVLHELVANDRVIGGIDPESTEKAKAFYATFVKGTLHSTNSRTAEMCKLTENSSRDAQIAFANELSIICDKAGIDVWELISLANKHPRVKILQPGCGVGGHCIAVDPYFIVADFPREAQIIAKARETNNYKAFWCVEKIQEAIKDFNIEKGRRPEVALMGLAFKPNIDDIRESPALYIVQRTIVNDNAFFSICEPNIRMHSVYKLSDSFDAYGKADIVVFLVSHDAFKTLPLDKEKTIIDFCGITKVIK
jgi:UDP-N-acetyl-D-mannosaminuronic acid dehydrogenase